MVAMPVQVVRPWRWRCASPGLTLVGIRLPSVDTTAGTTGISLPIWRNKALWMGTSSLAWQPLGVPRGLLGTALPFQYNHLEELESIACQHKNELAAIVMEPIRNLDPRRAFWKESEKLPHGLGQSW